MIFTKTEIPGVLIISPTIHQDNRGDFAETFKTSVFEKEGLNTIWQQGNYSFSKYYNTLRGLHYQSNDKNGRNQAQAKLVSCQRGQIFDIVLDIRKNSPTFGRYLFIELNATDKKSVYIPAGLAHGFITNVYSCEVIYLTSTEYCLEAERGIRWNDPFFNILWPTDDPKLSNKDANWPDFIPQI